MSVGFGWFMEWCHRLHLLPIPASSWGHENRQGAAEEEKGFPGIFPEESQLTTDVYAAGRELNGLIPGFVMSSTFPAEFILSALCAVCPHQGM